VGNDVFFPGKEETANKKTPEKKLANRTKWRAFQDFKGGGTSLFKKRGEDRKQKWGKDKVKKISGPISASCSKRVFPSKTMHPKGGEQGVVKLQGPPPGKGLDLKGGATRSPQGASQKVEKEGGGDRMRLRRIACAEVKDY